jgi:HlyD family secretion protein
MTPLFVLNRWLGIMLGSTLVFSSLAGCDEPVDNNLIQGYVEGEFVYVASPLAGTLEALHVRRGTQVQSGDSLFDLDNDLETAAREEAARRLAQARANLDDTKKGKRPSEIESVEAQLEQSVAAQTLAQRELERVQRLVPSGASTAAELDRARSNHDREQARVVQLKAELQTALLGARADQIAAAEAEVEARQAALVQAEWALAEKHQAAPQAGLVFDTLYRQGEWVAAGLPIVALLPAPNIKVRAFVPQTQIASVQIGDNVQVTADGLPQPLSGKISFISPQAEFTPPVIYSRESRSRLVFLIEVEFDAETAATLHPGQPVDVRLER